MQRLKLGGSVFRRDVAGQRGGAFLREGDQRGAFVVGQCEFGRLGAGVSGDAAGGGPILGEDRVGGGQGNIRSAGTGVAGGASVRGGDFLALGGIEIGEGRMVMVVIAGLL
jgi:hypothetical protein